MKLLTKLGNIFDKTINGLAYLAGAIIAFDMLSIFFEVVIRKLINVSHTWVVEFSEHSIVYMTFLGAAWLLKAEGHVSMDLLVNRLSPKNKALTNMILSVVGALLCMVLTWYSTATTLDFFERGIYFIKGLQLPMTPLLAPIPIGSILISIQFLRRSFGFWVLYRAPVELEAEIVEKPSL